MEVVRITSLQLENFMSFGPEEQGMTFTELNTIVGPNSSGKTNIFRAISLVGQSLTNTIIPAVIYHHGSNLEHPFKIKVGIMLEEKEINVVSDFFICSVLSESVNVVQPDKQELAGNLMKQFIINQGRQFFYELLRNFTIIVTSDGNHISITNVSLNIKKNDTELYYSLMGGFAKNPPSKGARYSQRLTDLIYNELKQRYPKLVNNYVTGKNPRVPNLSIKGITVFDFIVDYLGKNALRTIDVTGFALNHFEQRRENFPEIFRLLKFLSEKGYKDGGVSLNTLISSIFNSSIVRTSDLRSKPKSFLSDKSSFESDPSDFHNLGGETLPSILFALKNSENPSVKKRYNEILRYFKKINDGLEFDIGIRKIKIPITEKEIVPTSPDYGEYGVNIQSLGLRKKTNEVFEYELIIQFVSGDLSIPIEFAAAGRFEALLLLTALIGQKDKVILLDEPAVNLHPILQKAVLLLIEKSPRSDNQIFLITHSPYLVNPEKINSVWRFSTKNGNSIVRNLEKTILEMNEEDEQRIIQELRNSDVRSALFARGIVLVEGPSDKLVVEKIDGYLSNRKKGANLEANDWAVIDMGGKYSLSVFVGLAKKMDLPFVAVMDFDALMQCEKGIKINDIKVKTSAIPYCLQSANSLNKASIQKILRFERSIVKQRFLKKGTKDKYIEQFWYPQKHYKDLDFIAKSNKIFVFTKDLEGVLQQPSTDRYNKPLKALDSVSKFITEGNIPTEFSTLIRFIKKSM